MTDSRFRQFVDRRQAVALLAELCQRNPQRPLEPLPIVAFLAPGGGGKTMLLDLLAVRCEGVVPVARVEPEDLPSVDSYLELLCAAAEQLKGFSNRRYQRLAFPRLDLGVEVVAASLTRDNPGAVRQGVREVIAQRQRFFALLKELGAATDNWLIAIPLVLIRRALPWLNQRPPIAGRQPVNDVLAWYRQHATDLHLTGSAEGLDALVRLHEWSRPQRSAEQRAVADRLLLEAFLTDLEHAYDVTSNKSAAERTVNPLLLIDAFELLLQQHVGDRLLRDLGRRRSAGHFDPLLVVVGSDQRMLNPRAAAQSPPFEERDETLTAVSPTEYVRDLCNLWFAANRAHPADADLYLLPFWLHDFGLVDSSAYLASRFWPEGRIQAEDLALLAKLHGLTQGHPLALSLVADAIGPEPAPRPDAELNRLMEEPREHGRASVGGPLLDALLPEHADDAEAVWIESAAAPRRLTVAALEVLLRPEESGARERWDRLQRRTFARLAGPDRAELALHPLLRRLLLQRLEARPERYGDVHAKLLDHFAKLARDGDRPALAEALYHELALGNVEPAVASVAAAIADRDPQLSRQVAAAAEAPTVRMPADTLAQAVEALHDAKLDRNPEHLARALVLCSWLSNQPGLDAADRADRMYDLAESHRQLRRAWPGAGPDPVALFATAAGVSQAEIPAALTPPAVALEPPSTEPFPARTVGRARRYIRRAATVLALSSPVVFYLVLFFGAAGDLCNRPSFFAVRATVGATLSAKHISAHHADDNECIGISDGRYAFDQGTHERAGPLKARAAAAKASGDVPAANALWEETHEADTSDAEALIYRENERVLTLSQTENLPYVTIIAFTTLTAFSESRTAIGGGRDELQGIYVAQREHNDEFRVPLVRVLVANAGGNYKYAPDVARQVIEAARDDSSIVAVTGLSESRAETIEAIRLFAAARIPMISSTASSDTLSGISPYFFRIAPANRYQVRMGVRYAEEQLNVRNAILFKAVNDNYSESLAADFVREFVERDRNELLATEAYDAKDRNISNVILEKAGHACSFNPDLIYFTGRTDYMIRLLNSMNPCGDNSVRLMGGDELYQLITPPNSGYPAYAYNRLYFTAFAFPTMWEDAGLAEFMPSFYRKYPEQFDPGRAHRKPHAYGYSLANGHVVLAYDAMLTMLNGILGTVRTTGSTRFEPDDLRRSLFVIRGKQAIQGASGRIEFGPDNDPIGKVVVMLRVDRHGNTELIPNGILGNLRK